MTADRPDAPKSSLSATGLAMIEVAEAEHRLMALEQWLRQIRQLSSEILLTTISTEVYHKFRARSCGQPKTSDIIREQEPLQPEPRPGPISTRMGMTRSSF